MRRFHLALLSAPLLLVPFLACEDTTSSSSGTVSFPEGGGFEAGPTPEGGPIPEAGTDAPIDNFVPPKGAKVTVTKLGVVQADIRVIAHDATGAVIGDVKTNASGVVSFAAAPSMITVLTRLQGASPAAITYLGVADGDALSVAIPAFGGQPPVFAKFTATASVVAGATNYTFNTGDSCLGFAGPTGGPITYDLYPYCLNAQNAVLAAAFQDGSLLGYGFKKNQAKPASGATVDVGTITIGGKGTLTMTSPNQPPNTFVDAELRSIANSAGYFTANPSGAFDDGGYTFPIATGFAESYQSLLTARNQQGSPSSKGFLRREASNNTATQSLTYDFSTALPFITDGVVSGAVPARSDVTITAAASLAATDGGIIRLRWNLPGGVIPQPQWSFVVPPGTTTLKVPALPNDADANPYLPLAGTTVKDVVFVESTLIPGYAQVKALPLSSDGEPPTGIDVSTPLPLNGTVKITTWNRYIIPPPG